MPEWIEKFCEEVDEFAGKFDYDLRSIYKDKSEVDAYDYIINLIRIIRAQAKILKLVREMPGVLPEPECECDICQAVRELDKLEEKINETS